MLEKKGSCAVSVSQPEEEDLLTSMNLRPANNRGHNKSSLDEEEMEASDFDSAFEDGFYPGSERTRKGHKGHRMGGSNEAELGLFEMEISPGKEEVRVPHELQNSLESRRDSAGSPFCTQGQAEGECLSKEPDKEATGEDGWSLSEPGDHQEEIHTILLPPPQLSPVHAELSLNGKVPEDDLELDEKEYSVVYLVPDGGWGWMVLFGSILVNILIPGTVKSFGILFVEFLEVFNASPAAAAWIPAISYFLYSSTGPFAGALATKWSHRTVTVIGGLLASAGLMLSYFANSIPYLYVSYGIIGGLGAGLAYPIGVFMVGQYFEKRRGLANGLCTSGSALGSVLVPPLLRFLLSEYGYRWAILIMGALLLNVCLAAMFYDPVQKHMKRTLIPKQTEILEGDSVLGIMQEESPKHCPTVSSPIARQIETTPVREMVAASLPIAIPFQDFRERKQNSGRKATFQIGHEEESWSYKSNEMASPLARLAREEEKGPSSFQSPNKWSSYFTPAGIRVRMGQQNNSNSTGSDLVETPNLTLTTNPSLAGTSRLNLTAIPEADDLDEEDTPGKASNPDWNFYSNMQPGTRTRILRPNTSSINIGSAANLPRTMSMASNVSTSSFHYMSTIHHGSLLTAMQYDRNLPEFASTMTLKGVRSSCPCWARDKTDFSRSKILEKGEKEKEKGHIFKRCIDFSLLRDGMYLIMLISNSTSAVGYTNFIILLPSYAQDLGYDKNQAAFLLSCVALFDFFGRIGGAALSDLGFVSKKWYYIVGLLLSGVALAVLPFSRSYEGLLVGCGAFGLASGTYIGVTAVILADQLGAERLGSSYGLSLFVNGLLQLAGPPLCGQVYKATKRYEPILIGLGVTLILGASLWGAAPFVEKRRLAETNNNAGERSATSVV